MCGWYLLIFITETFMFKSPPTLTISVKKKKKKELVAYRGIKFQFETTK